MCVLRLACAVVRQAKQLQKQRRLLCTGAVCACGVDFVDMCTRLCCRLHFLWAYACANSCVVGGVSVAIVAGLVTSSFIALLYVCVSCPFVCLASVQGTPRATQWLVVTAVWSRLATQPSCVGHTATALCHIYLDRTSAHKLLQLLYSFAPSNRACCNKQVLDQSKFFQSLALSHVRLRPPFPLNAPKQSGIPMKSQISNGLTSVFCVVLSVLAGARLVVVVLQD